MKKFQKWGPKSQIRNGYGIRLYFNSLQRPWWPRKHEIGYAPGLYLAPWKQCFWGLPYPPKPKSGFVGQKVDFWKVDWIRSMLSNSTSDHFLSVGESLGTHFRPPTTFWRHLAKKYFLEFFTLILAYFWLQSKQNREQKFEKW